MLNQIYRVSFIGHRVVEHYQIVEEQLERIVRDPPAHIPRCPYG